MGQWSASPCADNATGVASKFGIKSIPTVILFKKGVAVQTVVGLHPKDYFVKMVESHLA